MAFLSKCGLKENKVLRDLVWWGTIIGVVVLNVLCLVGCTSTAPGVPELSLLTVHGPELSSVEHVDVGLYGLCIRTSHSLDCRPTAGYDIGTLIDSFHPPPNGTISPQLHLLLETSLRLQSKVLVSPLPGAGMAFSLGLVFWYLKQRSDPSSGKALPLWAGRLFWFFGGASLAIALGAALCTTVVVGAAVFVSELAPPDSPVLVAADTRHVIALQWVVVCLVLFFMLLAKERCGKSEAATSILPTTEEKKKAGPPDSDSSAWESGHDQKCSCGTVSSEGTLAAPYYIPPRFPGYTSDMSKQDLPPPWMRESPRSAVCPGVTDLTAGGACGRFSDGYAGLAPNAAVHPPQPTARIPRMPQRGFVCETETPSPTFLGPAQPAAAGGPDRQRQHGKSGRAAANRQAGSSRLAQQPAPPGPLPQAQQQFPQDSLPARPPPFHQSDAEASSPFQPRRSRSTQRTAPTSIWSQSAATGTQTPSENSREEIRARFEQLRVEQALQVQQAQQAEQAQAQQAERALQAEQALQAQQEALQAQQAQEVQGRLARQAQQAQAQRAHDELLAAKVQQVQDELARQAQAQAQAQKARAQEAQKIQAQQVQEELLAAKAALASAQLSRQSSRSQAAQADAGAAALAAAAAAPAPIPIPGLLVTAPTLEAAEDPGTTSDPASRARARQWDDKIPERSMSVQPGTRGGEMLQRAKSMSSGRNVKIDPTLLTENRKPEE